MARIFSGIQPSGELHIGNWLGAVRNWVNLQHDFESFYSIVDLHAVTAGGGATDPDRLAQQTIDMAIGLLSAGIDPEQATLFVQSHVPAHSELMWLLNAVTPVGDLERMTQYKDKSRGLKSIPAGLLNYPILQAADILLYRADIVPVGEDQFQHLELAREIARRWNRRFGGGEAFFPEPEQQYPWVRDSASLPYIKATGNALRSILETNLPSSLTAPPGDQQSWLEKPSGDELALERRVRYHISVT